MACIGCNRTCACVVSAGAGIVITGTGNAGAPWIINAIGASEYVDDTCSINISGDGTIGTPLTADLVMATSGGLKCTDGLGVGIKLDATSTATVTFSAAGIRINDGPVITTGNCLDGDGSGGDPLTVVFDPDGGVFCDTDGISIKLDPDSTGVTFSASGIKITGVGAGGSGVGPPGIDGMDGEPGPAGPPGATGATGASGGGIEVEDEGTPLTAAVTSIDFVGAGVVATSAGSDVTVTIAGGGGSSLYVPDNPDAWIDAFGAASAYDCEFNRTTNPTALPTNWVYQNQNGATYLEQLGMGIVSIASGYDTITKITCVVQPVSAAGSYTAVGKASRFSYNSGQNADRSTGLVLTDGTKAVGIIWNTNPFVLVSLWNDINGNYNSNPATAAILSIELGEYQYWRIVKHSATSYDFDFSTDGACWWSMLAAYDVSAFMTPTHFGFLLSQNANAQVFGLDWFRVR